VGRVSRGKVVGVRPLNSIVRHHVEIVVILLPVVALAAFMRTRKIHALITIPVAALLMPAWALFDGFVYPAEPKAQMWAPIAAAFGYAYGLVAAAVTCATFAIAARLKRRDV
jgi:hypothetical protein